MSAAAVEMVLSEVSLCTKAGIAAADQLMTGHLTLPLFCHSGHGKDRIVATPEHARAYRRNTHLCTAPTVIACGSLQGLCKGRL